MKRKFTSLLLWAISLVLFTGCAESERTVVILSTNDMHSQIEGFPALASAIQQCRDTAEVILVDGGDKFTGNAFVDLVKYHAPIFELMNKVEYDMSVYGNHEFDWGQEYIIEANKQATFDNIVANVISESDLFPQPQPYSIVERGGVKIAFVGVVGNDDHGHPSGKSSSYENLTFINPDETAAQYSYLKESEGCDLLILLSHSGVLRDREYASSQRLDGYDMIIGGHSHSVVDEVVNGIQLAQTGSRLKNIGATVITIKKGEEPQISYSNIPLSNYSPDEEVAQMVDRYLNNPELTAPIGEAAEDFSSTALKNLFTSTLKRATNADVGFYHSGGVRLSSIPKGGISVATILNMEPFSSKIATFKMTPEQMKGMIMAKFNDKENIGESHYIDLNCTAPYTVIRDESGDAIDIIFSTLKSGKTYTVVTGDYIVLSYKGLEYTDLEITEDKVATTLEDYVKSQEAISPDNRCYQEIK